MSRTLLLLRHAKSGYPDGVADHDRPLATRGRNEAALAGDWLRAEAPAVDGVFCSTAERTRQTLQLTAISAPARFDDRLYDATPGEVLAVLHETERTFGRDCRTVLVVGHEPVMSALALGLADPGQGRPAEASAVDLAATVAAKYPTSAIAVLGIAGPWAELAPHSAVLLDFHVPR